MHDDVPKKNNKWSYSYKSLLYKPIPKIQLQFIFFYSFNRYFKMLFLIIHYKQTSSCLTNNYMHCFTNWIMYY